jgi:crotonobetainyl-CoA:carnitine CoA-transferase CaiB-like acyl-CoA transferase
MLNNKRLALAARLHVLLRRKTGRVTDTEWMASNREYAAEIIRFSAEFAAREKQEDLADLAEKFAELMLPAGSAKAMPQRAESGFAVNKLIRYVGGLR